MRLPGGWMIALVLGRRMSPSMRTARASINLGLGGPHPYPQRSSQGVHGSLAG